jgi:hypothetical protein
MSYKALPVDPFVLGYYLVNGKDDLKEFITNKGYIYPLDLKIDFDFNNGLPLEYLQSSIEQRMQLFYGLLSSASISNGIALCTINDKLLRVFEQLCGSLGISFKVLHGS